MLVSWLRAVWSREDLAGAVEHASPVLARHVRTLCVTADPAPRDVRRAVLAVMRYLQRAANRATPFGWFSGVAAVSFAAEVSAGWQDRDQPVVRPDASWLTAVIRRLESCQQLLDRLPVLTNTSVFVRGDRLVVPYQQHPNAAHRAVEQSLAYTKWVQLAVVAGAAPIQVADVQAKILGEFPTTSGERVAGLLRELVHRGVLVSALHAPSTETDALEHLLAVLGEARAADITAIAELVDGLHDIAAGLAELRATPALSPRHCVGLAERMRTVCGDPDVQPLAVDLRLGTTLTLPPQVADEAARAAWVLARLSARPFGTPGWKAWHNRFYERYGIGTLVPVLEAVSDSGAGLPDGYPGAEYPERPLPGSVRDEQLLALAQRAALDGAQEVVLDEALIAQLELSPDEAGMPPHLRVGRRLPPHLEVAVRVDADDIDALRRGRFTVEVLSVSRGAGVLTGRFLTALEPAGRDALSECLAGLPGADEQTVVAQLSFAPLDPATAHVTRTPQVLPLVISVGEHRPPGPGVLTLADLAVGCDGRRLYLAVPKLGVRVEAVGLHALNLDTHTPPLARFLIELARANTAQVTAFDWGIARTLPFLPALRCGRVTVSPARWRLERAELPSRDRPWPEWDTAFAAWRERRRLPSLVALVEGDQRLPLDLDEPSHRVLLREHLAGAQHAVLTAAPARAASGWCGGRGHELIVPLTATTAPRWPRLPAPDPGRVVRSAQVYSPARAPVLLASLYGDPRRQDTLLTSYAPQLLDRLDGRPWWYMRYRDPDHHLRLRVGLADPDDFGPVAAVIAEWADELRGAGLVRDLRLPTWSPEYGRWGDGPAWQAAEAVFRAGSRAVLAQLCQPARPGRRALVAAHTVAIATAFTGSVNAGMRWLVNHIPAATPARVPRPEFAEAVTLADPDGGWAALHAEPGGAAIVDAWMERDHALADYRERFPSPHTVGVDVDDVLGSLLHVTFVQAVGIDFAEEAICLHLARSAALAWQHRHLGGAR
ncbi:lantibiotic dehydratase [Dactylosporangium sp. NPDC005572]|uniref:lantibiotic dehydratase n=1 Tax=Dactylosporangium sp. NPDC005572 TaxID=3156889 RepID=UPI0033A5CA3C